MSSWEVLLTTGWVVEGGRRAICGLTLFCGLGMNDSITSNTTSTVPPKRMDTRVKGSFLMNVTTRVIGLRDLGST